MRGGETADPHRTGAIIGIMQPALKTPCIMLQILAPLALLFLALVLARGLWRVVYSMAAVPVAGLYFLFIAFSVAGGMWHEAGSTVGPDGRTYHVVYYNHRDGPGLWTLAEKERGGFVYQRYRALIQGSGSCAPMVRPANEVHEGWRNLVCADSHGRLYIIPPEGYETDIPVCNAAYDTRTRETWGGLRLSDLSHELGNLSPFSLISATDVVDASDVARIERWMMCTRALPSSSGTVIQGGTPTRRYNDMSTVQQRIQLALRARLVDDASHHANPQVRELATRWLDTLAAPPFGVQRPAVP